MAAERDISPLELMLQNMRFFHAQAEVLTEKVARLERKCDRTSGSTDPKTLAKIAKMKAQAEDSRMESQRWAVDAAPYVHPRPARIKPVDESTRSVEIKFANDAGADGSVPVSGSNKRQGSV